MNWGQNNVKIKTNSRLIIVLKIPYSPTLFLSFPLVASIYHGGWLQTTMIGRTIGKLNTHNVLSVSAIHKKKLRKKKVEGRDGWMEGVGWEVVIHPSTLPPPIPFLRLFSSLIFSPPLLPILLHPYNKLHIL